MTWSITPTRAVLRAALPTLGIAVLAFACPAQAFKATSKGGSENLPLSLSSPTSGAHTSATGPSLVRTIVGLVIVIAVIWGLTWILRQVKSGRGRSAAGSGLTSMASLPLGAGRTLHLVRAGRDYLLLGSAEHGVVPIYRYTEQQALETGLLDGLEEPAEERAEDGGAFAARGDFNLVERLREWTVRR
ncbi:MAG TPA: flagellar biosynthetic protein FliO [Solirubrobacteraceae bacterium]|jgi:flagellar protein FliO/FliZ|nr:flagellar biosynthetic protein FliO [Solirubrobacteraceae bacterium]